MNPAAAPPSPRHSLRELRAMALAGLLVLLGLAFATPALAATHTVANFDDSGQGSLRQAITDANGDTSPPVVVDFAPGLHGVLNLISGPLQITDSMTIEGPGAGVIDVDGDNSQIMQIPSTSSTVSISGLEFSGGHSTAPDGSTASGGAIDNSGTLNVSNAWFDHNSAGTSADPNNDSGTGVGGAISNGGTLTVSDSTFTDNTAGGSGGDGVDSSEGIGGAIESFSSLTVTGSTFTGNSAGGDGGTGDTSGAGTGGAILATGSLTLVNSTITGNSAGGVSGSGMESGQGFGGGVDIAHGPSGATATLKGDTIDGNRVGSASGSDGAGIANQGTTSIVATIVSGNADANNCTNTVLSISGSMSVSKSLEGPAGQTSCGFDLPSADPLLGPLADNGGPTETQALGAGSPAIGAVAPTSDCPVNDERGALRPQGGCDVGAYEVAPPFIGAATATSTGLTTATLDASVSNPDVFAGTVSFQYGTSAAYGTTTAAQAISAGGAPGAYGALLTNLAPGTVYHYRVVATNPDGTTFGPDEQFATASPTPPAQPSRPANTFTFGKAMVGPRGAITVLVNAPDAGRFTARATFTVLARKGHKRVKTTFTYGTASVRSRGRGTFKLVIGLRGRTARELKLLGHRQVTIIVTFTPSGGSAHHRTKNVTVKRNRKGKYS